MKFLIITTTLLVTMMTSSFGLSAFKKKQELSAFGENGYFISQTETTRSFLKRKEPRTIRYRLVADSFRWEIAPGESVEAWGYNHQVPGPVLKARKGDTLVITLQNNLPEKTTIHWHGLRIPSVMDGTEEVQRAVMPGESFEYRFVVPDAGTFWYHPHSNETVQMERGMYGAIIVEDDHEPAVDADRLFMIDDMKLTKDNSFRQPAWFLPRWLERHDGREGETLLLNGKINPEIEIASGHTERWRLINSSSARYFLLHLSGKPFRVIGTDGGLLGQPVTMTQLLISPGERADIAIGPFMKGDSFKIQSLPYDRGTGKGKLNTFGDVRVGEDQTSVALIPDTLNSIEPIASEADSVTRTIKLHGKRSWKDGVDFMINDQMHLNDAPVRVGELQVWEITNPSMLDHPFHLHGFFFQVLEVNGVKPAYLSWKDTFNVPRGGKIRIAWMPDNRPGKWMYHCHILEHHAAGMMANFEVTDGTTPLTYVPGTTSQTCH